MGGHTARDIKIRQPERLPASSGWDDGAEVRVVLRREADLNGVAGLVRVQREGETPLQNEAEQLAMEAFEAALPRLEQWRKDQVVQMRMMWRRYRAKVVMRLCVVLAIPVAGTGAAVWAIKEQELHIFVGCVAAVALIVSCLVVVACSVRGLSVELKLASREQTRAAALDVQAEFEPFNAHLSAEAPHFTLSATDRQAGHGLNLKTGKRPAPKWALEVAPNWTIAMELRTNHAPTPAAFVGTAASTAASSILWGWFNFAK